MRARNIKPGFFINEQLSDVDFQTRLLFIGLWCYADREGRFQWIPKRIKVAIFPYDKLDTPAIETMLCNLMSLHLITCHDKVGYIENFKKHQSPHPHEAKSILPSPPEKPQQNQCHDMSLTLHGLSGECHSDIRILGCSDIIIPDVIKPKVNKTKKETTTSLHDSFNMFYTAYPKHVGKDAAIKAWKKLNPADSLLQTILQALANAKGTDNWQKDKGSFIPYPATWLNGKRWEDELNAGEKQPLAPEPLSKDSVLKWSQYSDTIMDFHCNCIQAGKEHIVARFLKNTEYPYYKETPRTAEQWEKFIMELPS